MLDPEGEGIEFLCNNGNSLPVNVAKLESSQQLLDFDH